MKQDYLEEFVKSRENPAYFMSRYVRVTHPVRGLVPFKLYPFQKKIVKDLDENRFNVLRKFRQAGCTTIAGAYSLHFTNFNKYKTVEFRHHSGTTDKNKIINWVALTSKIMDFCSHARTTLKEDTEPSLENMAELLRLEDSNYGYYYNRQQHFLNTYGDIYEECAALPPRPKKKKIRKQPKQPSLKIRHKKA